MPFFQTTTRGDLNIMFHGRNKQHPLYTQPFSSLIYHECIQQICSPTSDRNTLDLYL
ncbi:unnamed protein product, partial [Dicrocoelium dendriticum]